MIIAPSLQAYGRLGIDRVTHPITSPSANQRTVHDWISYSRTPPSHWASANPLLVVQDFFEHEPPVPPARPCKPFPAPNSIVLVCLASLSIRRMNLLLEAPLLRSLWRPEAQNKLVEERKIFRFALHCLLAQLASERGCLTRGACTSSPCTPVKLCPLMVPFTSK